MKGIPKKIIFYVTKEVLFSFWVAFSFFVLIFIVNQILFNAEILLARKVPLFEVILLILFSIPSILAISAPNGALVGVLMAAGRLSTDNEVLAFQALGLSLKKIFVPVFFLGIIFSLGSFIINDYLLPLGQINYMKLYKELVFSSPELELSPYTFKNYQNSTIITAGLLNGVYEHLIIIDKTAEQKSRLIYAQNARLDKSGKDQGIIKLVMEDVVSIVPDKPKNDFEYLTASEMEYNILLSSMTDSVQSITPREMSSIDVFREIEKKKESFDKRLVDWNNQIYQFRFDLKSNYLTMLDQLVESTSSLNLIERDVSPPLDRLMAQLNRDISDRSIFTWEMELYQKFSIPLACVLFVILAFPLGLYNKRSGRTVGFGIGILIAVLYYGLIIGSRTVGIQLQLPPFISMFFPNFVILVSGVSIFTIRFSK